jgi:guanylate kinase
MAGTLFVISAPSGAGKSSVIRLLLERGECPRLDYSVSYTTRPPRAGEVDGVDYIFVDEATFKKMIEEDGFLEWARVFDNFYGTGLDWVNRRLATDRDVLVDVDVIGAKNLKSRFPSAVMIFMVPPRRAELIRRLTYRQTEDSEGLKVRLAQSNWEISQRDIFDFLVINDDLTIATREVESVVQGRGGRRLADEESFWPKFFQEN